MQSVPATPRTPISSSPACMAYWIRGQCQSLTVTATSDNGFGGRGAWLHGMAWQCLEYSTCWRVRDRARSRVPLSVPPQGVARVCR